MLPNKDNQQSQDDAVTVKEGSDSEKSEHESYNQFVVDDSDDEDDNQPPDDDEDDEDAAGEGDKIFDYIHNYIGGDIADE